MLGKKLRPLCGAVKNYPIWLKYSPYNIQNKCKKIGGRSSRNSSFCKISATLMYMVNCVNDHINEFRFI